MDKLIPFLYKEYGKYINHSRAFPLDIDGLKPVERRVLLSAYQIAKDKFVKSARVDGHTLGHFHPHSSSYSTIVQLVNQGLLDGQGNFGNSIGVEESPAAAMRYTEVKLSKLTNEIALKLIDHVKFVESELDDEPEFFPTMFPLCLLGREYTVGIGFGYKTLIPCYDLNDLKNRLLYLLNINKEKQIIKPITDCKIISTDNELEQLLTTGKSTINLQGFYKVDNVKCRAIVKSWPYGKRFESILSKFERELNNQDIGWIDESSGDNNGTHIVFEVLKQRNRNEIFKQFIKKLDDVLKGSISFEIVVTDSYTKNVKNSSVDKMLLDTFKKYISVNMVMLNSNKEKIESLISENVLLEKIRPSLSKYLKNKDLKDVDSNEIINNISIETNQDKDKIKELFQKYRIMKLLTFNSDNNELKIKLKEVENNIKNINNFVLDQYQKL